MDTGARKEEVQEHKALTLSELFKGIQEADTQYIADIAGKIQEGNGFLENETDETKRKWITLNIKRLEDKQERLEGELVLFMLLEKLFGMSGLLARKLAAKTTKRTAREISRKETANQLDVFLNILLRKRYIQKL